MVNVFESEQDFKKEAKKEGKNTEEAQDHFWRSWAIGATTVTILTALAYKFRLKLLETCKTQMGPGFHDIDTVARAAALDKKKKKTIEVTNTDDENLEDSLEDEREKIRMHHKANEVQFQQLKRRSSEVTAMEDDLKAREWDF